MPQWLRLRTPIARHGALPGGRLPDVRDGRHPRRLPCRCRAAHGRRRPRPRRDRSRRRGAGVDAVGQQPVQPDRRARRPRRGRRVGSSPRRAGVQRRVLRRVHLGRAGRARSSSTDSTASSRCTRCRSGRTSPGSGSASTPATPRSSTTCRRCASTSGCWCPVRPRRPAVVALGRRRPRRRAARPLPPPTRADGARCSSRWSGIDDPAAGGRVLPLVRRRRRVGVRRATRLRRAARW